MAWAFSIKKNETIFYKSNYYYHGDMRGLEEISRTVPGSSQAGSGSTVQGDFFSYHGNQN